jgi:hypothetical protein
MKIYVLTSETVYDATGEMMDAGEVIGVYSSYALADSGIDDAMKESCGFRRRSQYDIKEYEVE